VLGKLKGKLKGDCRKQKNAWNEPEDGGYTLNKAKFGRQYSGR
jgi:hypothetical protein